MTKIQAEYDLTISKEIQSYLAPLTREELDQLEENLVKEGCRESLVAWVRKDGKLILIDGHNRLKICQKHSIPFKVKKIPFDNLESVKLWMIDNQIGRRNLTSGQLSYYRGTKYLAIRGQKGGYKNVNLKGQSTEHSSELLAKRFNVSESTIKRDAKYAEGLDIIGRTNPKLKTEILLGRANVKRADILMLCEAPDRDKLNIRNEADLHNKAANIRNNILEEVENRMNRINEERIEKAGRSLRESEPLFLSKEDRIKRIKERIVGAINRAISKNDATVIGELKKLINDLEKVLSA